MILAAKHTADRLIGRGLIAAETVAQELRERLIERLSEYHAVLNEAQLIELAREVLAEFEPILARAMQDTEIASWVLGANVVFGKLPVQATEAISIITSVGAPPSQPPIDVSTLFYPGDDEPVVRFPLAEKAAQNLLDRNVVTRAEFDRLTDDAKARAFTAARIDSEETLVKLRDALADVVREGPSLRIFRERVADVLDTTAIGPAHLETIYRTNIQTAFQDGHDNLASHPVVAEVFPYEEYIPIHDGRVDEQHLALGSLGLNGTGVYRRDDPFWDVFRPPWRWNCRCGTNLLTKEAAAAKGVQEAQRWIETGEPPAVPEWRLNSIPFRPRPGWSRRRSVAA